ncbi:SH3 domain-containing protein [Aquabacter sp. CN5-332]|uniref:SH3 domain-containing protein n=1 Tax=Aquabacter sp. CN5-332 TaxID=3156608 RepID=UPI0032B56C70
MPLSRFFLASAFVLLVFPAAAQSPDAMRFAGTYSTSTNGGHGGCTIRLTANTTIFGGYGASSQGCGGSLMSLSRWNIAGYNIVLMDGNGQILASVGPNRGGLSGGTSDGSSVRMTRSGGSAGGLGITPPGFNMSITPPGFGSSGGSGCRVYYGWNGTKCAPSNDLDAPVLLANATAIIRVLGTNNVRQEPSFSSGIVGQIPVNSCVRADSCGRYGDTDWCRVQYNGRTGWMAKQQSASNGRRYTLFSNRCGS